MLASVSKLKFIPDFENSKKKLPIWIHLVDTAQIPPPQSEVRNITLCSWIFGDAFKILGTSTELLANACATSA